MDFFSLHSAFIRRIHPENPQSEIIFEAAERLIRGGVVAFPTRCLYGLGVDAFNFAALARVFEIKQRPVDKPLLVLIQNTRQLDRLVKYVPPFASRIMDNFWPGRVTVVFEAKESVPDILTAGTGKIGIRWAGHAVASALVNAAGRPITGTSANLSGRDGCCRIKDMDHRILKHLDLILDAGPLKGGRGSTVVDATASFPAVLREGEVSAAQIRALFD